MKLSIKWDDEMGEYRYFLKKENAKKEVFEGDVLWAQRVAKHYKLKFPRPPEA